MEYRYYIYKQSLIPTNFNKYDITQYDYLCEITNNSQWSLNIERNSDWFTVIRQEFNGSISVTGNDYNALIAIEGEPYQYAIVIHRKCGGAYSEFWKGFFSYFDYKVDMDRCILSFTPKVWDAYSPVFDQMDVERNVLVADTPTNVFMDRYEYEIEDVIYSYIGFGGVFAAWNEFAYDPTNYPAGNKYYLFQITAEFIEETDAGGGLIVAVYHYTEIYRREFQLSTSNLPVGSWVLDPLLTGGEVSPGVYKWVRPYLDIPNPPAGGANYNFINSGDDIIQTLTNTVGDSINLKGGIYLNSVLELYADIFNLDYTSNFFEDDPNPLGGITLDKTMINHISNLRSVSEVATKGMMKLKDLLIWIRNTFNAYWYIDSNGDFRVEHRKYFDFGLSYTYAIVTELDMSTVYPTQVKNMRRYEWKEPELSRYERLEMAFMYMADWIDSKIEYKQNSIHGNSTRSYPVEWSSDLVGITDNIEDLPKKGWALMDVEQRGGGALLYWIRNTVGDYSGSTIPNGRFSPANLYADYWDYGRTLPTGYVNGKLTSFITVEKLRQQEELTFPMCCQDIDFNGVFRTPLGDGIIDKAEYEAKTGNLKINLIYE